MSIRTRFFPSGLNVYIHAFTQSFCFLYTLKGEAEDRFAGFELGADDYLVKPFLPKELLLRVQAILKRAYPEKNHVVQLETAAANLDQAEVVKNGQRIPLTAKEYSIFQKLAENAGRIVTV